MGTIAYDYSRSIAGHSVNRRRSTEAYRRVMSTWPSMINSDIIDQRKGCRR